MSGSNPSMQQLNTRVHRHWTTANKNTIPNTIWELMHYDSDLRYAGSFRTTLSSNTKHHGFDCESACC